MRTWWERSGAPPGALGDVVLAVTEAVANAVVHAYAGRGDGEVEIRLSTTACGDAEVSVRDFGAGMQAVSSARGGAHLGLALMRELADSVEITDASPGTLVRMRFRVGRAD